MRNYPNPEIAAGIARAIAHIDSIRAAHYAKHYPSQTPAPITVDPDGVKFARLMSGSSAYCFVALVDGSNKKMGAWKEGDIFKPDGWKAPAKHARGNVYTDLSRLDVHGPEYLK